MFRPSSSDQSSSLLARALILILLAVTLPICQAQDTNKSVVLYPVGGETFYYSDLINATFITPYTGSGLVKTFCRDESDKIRWLWTGNSTVGPGTVWALVAMNVTSMVNCWLQLSMDDKDIEKQVNSLHFTVANKRRTPTTLGLPSVFEPAATSTPTPTVGIWATEGGPSTVQGRLSSGAIAGMVIGTVAGVAGLVVLGFLCWRRRKLQGDKVQNTPGSPVWEAPASVSRKEMSISDGSSTPVAEVPVTPATAAELDANSGAREMPGQEEQKYRTFN